MDDVSWAFDQDGIEGRVFPLPPHVHTFWWYDQNDLSNVAHPLSDDNEPFSSTSDTHSVNVPDGAVLVECWRGGRRWFESMPKWIAELRFHYMLQDGELIEKSNGS